MNIRLSDHFSYRKLIRFTLPTILNMIFSSIYGVVDGLFVTNVVGSEAFASINLILPFVYILGGFGFMVGTGGSALISKTLGEGKKEKANRYFSMLLYLLFLLGVTSAVIGILFIRPISLFLGASKTMVPDCVIYGRILLTSLPFFMLQYSFQSFLIVAEKPRMGLFVSVLAGVTNMVLDFFFVFCFRWGVAGAAAATGLSSVVGGLVPFCLFLRKDRYILQIVRTRLELRPILQSCANGLSEMVTNISISVVSMLYNWQLMRIAGSAGVVSYGIIMYVGFIFSGTYVGYAVGTAPVIGYHYGAGNTEELHSLLMKSLKLILIASFIMTGLAEVFAGVLAKIFVGYDPALLAMTSRAIRLFSISYLICGINIFASSFFTALNNGVVSAILSFLRTFVFLVAAIFIAPVFLGLDGIWLAVVFAEGLALFISLFSLKIKQSQYQY